MLIKRSNNPRTKSVYECDACGRKIISKIDYIYILTAKKTEDKKHKTWHLCKQCFKPIYKILERRKSNMKYVSMYYLNLDNLGDIELISQQQYVKALGLSTDYINKIFNGKLAVKLSTAKCIISLAYNISIRDNEQMKELLEKHFSITK